MNESPSYVIQYDEYGIVNNMAAMVVFVWNIFSGCSKGGCVMCTLPINSTAEELCSALKDYISGKLHWLFCVDTCMKWADSLARWLFGFNTGVTAVISECEMSSMPCVIHKEMLASWKLPCKFNNGLQDVIKIISQYTEHALESHLWQQLSEEWTQGT